jgi:hypothetical protein
LRWRLTEKVLHGPVNTFQSISLRDHWHIDFGGQHLYEADAIDSLRIGYDDSNQNAIDARRSLHYNKSPKVCEDKKLLDFSQNPNVSAISFVGMI